MSGGSRGREGPGGIGRDVARALNDAVRRSRLGLDERTEPKRYRRTDRALFSFRCSKCRKRKPGVVIFYLRQDDQGYFRLLLKCRACGLQAVSARIRAEHPIRPGMIAEAYLRRDGSGHTNGRTPAGKS